MSKLTNSANKFFIYSYWLSKTKLSHQGQKPQCNLGQTFRSQCFLQTTANAHLRQLRIELCKEVLRKIHALKTQKLRPACYQHTTVIPLNRVQKRQPAESTEYFFNCCFILWRVCLNPRHLFQQFKWNTTLFKGYSLFTH